MNTVSSYILPCIIGLILGFGLYKKINIFDTFVKGAKEGISVGIKIIPVLIALMTGVGMLKASGAVEILVNVSAPLMNALHIPGELLPLALLRPISGSGSLVVFEDILKSHGADSLIGRIASVMQGSTETTFYVIAVYFGAANIKKTRYTLFCALVADFVGFVVSSACVHLLMK